MTQEPKARGELFCRLPTITIDQLNEIKKNTGMTKAEIVMVAVDKYYADTHLWTQQKDSEQPS